MSPNLFLALKTAVSPHQWFTKSDSHSTSSKSASRRTSTSTFSNQSHPKGPGPQKPHSTLHLVQHCNKPEPGLYKHIPGCGWFQIATYRTNTGQSEKHAKLQLRSPDSGTFSISDEQWEKVLAQPQAGYTPIDPPRGVVYSKVLKRFLFEDEFRARKKVGRVAVGEPQTDKNGRPAPPSWAAKKLNKRPSGFFRLDDGVSWVRCWDAYSEFLKGPWELYCLDESASEHNGKQPGKDGQAIFRLMRVGDRKYGVHDEKWKTRRAEMLAEKERERQMSKDGRKKGSKNSSGRSSRSSGVGDEETSRQGSVASSAFSRSDNGEGSSVFLSRMPSVSEEAGKQPLQPVEMGPVAQKETLSLEEQKIKARSAEHDFAEAVRERLRIDDEE